MPERTAPWAEPVRQRCAPGGPGSPSSTPATLGCTSPTTGIPAGEPPGDLLLPAPGALVHDGLVVFLRRRRHLGRRGPPDLRRTRQPLSPRGPPVIAPRPVPRPPPFRDSSPRAAHRDRRPATLVRIPPSDVASARLEPDRPRTTCQHTRARPPTFACATAWSTQRPCGARTCLSVLGIGQQQHAHPRAFRDPDSLWTVQQIRNLLMDLGDRAAEPSVPGPGPGRAVHPGHKRHRSRVQLRTGPYSSRNRRQKHLQQRVTLPRTTPRAPPGRTPPRTRHAQAQPPQQARAPAAYPRCAPSMYYPGPRATGQRRHHPGPAPPDANASDRSRPARERHTTQETFSAPP